MLSEERFGLYLWSRSQVSPKGKNQIPLFNTSVSQHVSKPSWQKDRIRNTLDGGSITAYRVSILEGWFGLWEDTTLDPSLPTSTKKKM